METFNFINYFLDYTKSMESPTEFFRWAALVAISATAKNNLYFERGLLKIHPNIYVLLFAKSGMARKAVPMKTILPFIEEMKNTHIVNGRSSIQGVVQTLSQDFTNARGELIKGAAGFLYAEELASFIVQDPATISILTDLADYHATWSNNLVSREPVTLKDVCVTFFGATNEELFRQVYDRSAVYGGLLGRTLIIYAERMRHKNALVRDVVNIDAEPLKQHLVAVSKLRGNMLMTEDAIETFERWYIETDFEKHDSNTGLEARLATHVKKIAMLLRLAEAPLSLVIDAAHINLAIDMVMALVPNYRMIVAGSGVTEVNKQCAVILSDLLKVTIKGQSLTKAQLLRNHWSSIDIQTFDRVIETLSASELIVEKASGGIVRFEATKKAIELYVKTANKP